MCSVDEFGVGDSEVTALSFRELWNAGRACERGETDISWTCWWLNVDGSSDPGGREVLEADFRMVRVGLWTFVGSGWNVWNETGMLRGETSRCCTFGGSAGDDV